MAYFAGIGLGSTLLPGVLWAKVAAVQTSAPRLFPPRKN